MTILNFNCNGQTFRIHMPDHHRSHEWRNGVPPSDAVTFHPRSFSLMRGLVVTGSVLIKISPFYYIKDGEFHVFPQTTLNTTPYLATTPNKVRLAVVGFNISTELIEVYTGDEVIFSALTPPPLPTGMATGFYPSFLVRLRYNTTELFETDITDARFALMEQSGGSNAWPLAGQNLLGATNYSTATLLIAAMSDGDIGYLGSRISAEAVDVNKTGIILQGVDKTATVFTTPFLISAETIVKDVGIEAVSGAYALSVTANPVDLYRIIANHSGVANARGIIISEATRLYECEGIATSTGTTARGVYVTNAVPVEIHGGYFAASGGTAFEIFADAGCSVLLNGPVLEFGNIGGAGDIFGHYLDTLGGIHYVYRSATITKGWEINSNLIASNLSGMSGGVWLLRTDGLRIKYDTLSLAIADAATLDVIKLGPGTYSLTALETLADIGLTIEGESPQSTIITSSIAGNCAFFVNAANITFRNITVQHTGAGIASGCFQVNANNFTLDNAIIEKTSGAPTTGYAAWLYAGTGHRFTNSRLTCTSGTTKYGIQNTLAAISLTVEGGSVQGNTFDIFGDQAGSSIDLIDPVLVNNLISFSGTLEGWYFNASGHHYAVSLSRLIWTPPAFRVHKNNTSQTGIVTVTFTKLTWSTESYDTHGWFASDKFTPLLAGKYFFDVKVYFDPSIIDQSLIYAFIYKNGVNTVEFPTVPSGTGGHQIRGTVILDANGSTDFFELYVFHSTGANEVVSGNAAVTNWVGIYMGR